MLVLEDGRSGDIGAEEVEAGLADKDTEDGNHGDTAVLELRLSVLHEVLLVIGADAEGVEESEWAGDASLFLGVEGDGSGGGGLGDDDGVNDVDDAVVADDVGGDDLGVVNLDTLWANRHRDLSAVEGLHLLSVKGDNSLGKDFAGDNVVCEDVGECGDIL